MFHIPTPLALTKWFFGLFGLKTEYRCNKKRLQAMQEHCQQCHDEGAHHNCDPINRVQNVEVCKHIHELEKVGGQFWNYYHEGEDFDSVRVKVATHGPNLGSEQDHKMLRERMLTPDSVYVSSYEGHIISETGGHQEPPK